MCFIGRAPGFRVWFTIMSLGTRAVGFGFRVEVQDAGVRDDLALNRIVKG